MAPTVSDWIEWKGGTRPVDVDTDVQFRGRSRPEIDSSTRKAGALDWAHRPSFDNLDIIAYRLVSA